MNNELEGISVELQKLYNKGMKIGAYDLNDTNIFIQILTRLTSLKLESNEQPAKEGISQERPAREKKLTKAD